MNGFKLIKYLNRFKFQKEIMGYYNVFLLKFNPTEFSTLVLSDNAPIILDIIIEIFESLIRRRNGIINIFKYFFRQKYTIVGEIYAYSQIGKK